MKKPEQMPFDLGHAAALTRADFFASACNENALAWVDRWPDWPAPALVVHGPAGCGKTHLSRIWRKKSGAADGPDMNASAAVIDDAEKFIGNVEDEKRLFHLYNAMKEKGGHILLTALTPPAAWNFALPDLKSRLVAAPAVAVLPPDDALMAVVLAKMFSDRQVFVPQDVISFLLPRMERSFEALRALVEKIDRKAMAEKRPVTVPMVRDVLKDEPV